LALLGAALLVLVYFLMKIAMALCTFFSPHETQQRPPQPIPPPGQRLLTIELAIHYAAPRPLPRHLVVSVSFDPVPLLRRLFLRIHKLLDQSVVPHDWLRLLAHIQISS
jgi:hypothetical protein